MDFENGQFWTWAGPLIAGRTRWNISYRGQKSIPVKPKDIVIPEVLSNLLKDESYEKRETCLSLNLLLQFFFQEKRHELSIIKWLTNQLSIEFEELLRTKALGKFIQKMQIHDLDLGHNFPVIKAVTTKNVSLQ